MTLQRSLSKTGLTLFVALALSVTLFAVSPAPLRAQDPPPASHAAGILAYIGLDDNVYRLDPATDEPTALTDDASTLRRYYWPTWSSDGRLAFFAHEIVRGGALHLQVYVTPPGETAAVLAYESDTEQLTYAYWAPSNCEASAHCRDLAVLLTTANGLRAIRIRDEAPDFTTEMMGRGAPFYYSYSPDATRMIWQRFGTRLELYDTARNEVIDRLPDTVGVFQAPMWSPVDDRLLFSTLTDEGEHNLVIAAGEERQVIAANQRGVLWFAWSPDGAHVAYKRNHGRLAVVGAQSGEEIVGSSTNGVVAFFWSPDGQRIAYLTLPSSDDAPQVRAIDGPREVGGLASPPRQGNSLPTLTWHVLDLATHTNRVLVAFTPTAEMAYLVAFFDQFAQSHRVWSPDSRYLVYSDNPADGPPTINLIDATDPAAEPIIVAEGQVGVWSFN